MKHRTAPARKASSLNAEGGLEVRGVSHLFGHHTVLNELSFSIEAGEHLALMGPSGCGKSTLLRLISGLEEVQAGTISLRGRILSAGKTSVQSPVHLPPEARGIGMVFQDHALFPHLTVLGNVLFPMNRMNQRAAREKAAHLLSAVGLAGFFDRYPSSLSGGQRQRLALARTLAQDAEVILLDEPFSGLDQALRESVRGHARELLKQKNVTSLLVTHDPFEALNFGDRVMVMDEGRVIQIGTPAEIRRCPASLPIARLLWDVRPVVCADGSACTAAELAVVLGIDQKSLGTFEDCAAADAAGPTESARPGLPPPAPESKPTAYLASSALLPRAAAGLVHMRRPHVLRCSVSRTQMMNDQVLVTLATAGGTPVRQVYLQTLVPAWLAPAWDGGADSDSANGKQAAPGAQTHEWALDLERLFIFSE